MDTLNACAEWLTSAEPSDGFFGKIVDAINSNDPHGALDDDATVADMHARAEVFKPETEEVFRYLQVPPLLLTRATAGANKTGGGGLFSMYSALDISCCVHHTELHQYLCVCSTPLNVVGYPVGPKNSGNWE